jgi:hypothetical protein
LATSLVELIVCLAIGIVHLFFFKMLPSSLKSITAWRIYGTFDALLGKRLSIKAATPSSQAEPAREENYQLSQPLR